MHTSERSFLRALKIMTFESESCIKMSKSWALEHLNSEWKVGGIAMTMISKNIKFCVSNFSYIQVEKYVQHKSFGKLFLRLIDSVLLGLWKFIAGRCQKTFYSQTLFAGTGRQSFWLIKNFNYSDVSNGSFGNFTCTQSHFPNS